MQNLSSDNAKTLFKVRITYLTKVYSLRPKFETFIAINTTPQVVFPVFTLYVIVLIFNYKVNNMSVDVVAANTSHALTEPSIKAVLCQ
jgi:hypothetical protein